MHAIESVSLSSHIFNGRFCCFLRLCFRQSFEWIFGHFVSSRDEDSIDDGTAVAALTLAEHAVAVSQLLPNACLLPSGADARR
jgi:hypothetical protein